MSSHKIKMDRTPKKPIVIGDTFGKWEVVAPASQLKSPGGNSLTAWTCRCECGAVRSVAASRLRRGIATNCGCVRHKAGSAGRKSRESKPAVLVGNVYGRYTVEGPSADRKYYWICKCECGTVKDVCGRSLRNNGTHSCGCLRSEVTSARSYRHGLNDSPEQRSWWAMVARCYYKRNENYERYGGRGIRVCERWMEDDGAGLKNFVEDMGLRPEGMTVDRRDPNGHYEPDNCRWATDEQQRSNTRRSRMLTHDGITMTVSAWARRTGIDVGTIQFRLRSGWTVEEALTIPVRSLESRTLSHNGLTLTLKEWSARLSVPYHTLYSRINSGMAVWDVLAEELLSADDRAMYTATAAEMAMAVAVECGENVSSDEVNNRDASDMG